MRPRSVHLMLEQMKEEQNKWFKVREGSIYLRRGNRYLSNQVFVALDISHVHFRAAERGKGAFTEYLNLFESLAHGYGYRAIFVENVSDRLLNFFIARGYHRVEHIHSPCFYTIVKTDVDQTKPPVPPG